jgi:hypothetical protein
MPDVLILRVEGDPTWWVLDTVIESERLKRTSEPVAVPVNHPLQGTLLLSAHHAGSVALLKPPLNVGWIPSDVEAPAPVLYVASAVGPTNDFPGYQLPRTADFGTLEHDIKAAMREGTILEVPLGPSLSGNVLLLNGAELRLAVLGRASGQAADPG